MCTGYLTVGYLRIACTISNYFPRSHLKNSVGSISTTRFVNLIREMYKILINKPNSFDISGTQSRYNQEHSNPRLGNLFFWWLVWWLRKSAIFFIVWGLCLVIWVIPGGLTCLDSHHLVLSRTFKSKSSLSCQSDRSRPSIVVVVVYLSVGVYLSIVSLGLRSFHLMGQIINTKHVL